LPVPSLENGVPLGLRGRQTRGKDTERRNINKDARISLRDARLRDRILRLVLGSKFMMSDEQLKI
jgi:hypothetical protein